MHFLQKHTFEMANFPQPKVTLQINCSAYSWTNIFKPDFFPTITAQNPSLYKTDSDEKRVTSRTFQGDLGNLEELV